MAQDSWWAGNLHASVLFRTNRPLVWIRRAAWRCGRCLASSIRGPDDPADNPLHGGSGQALQTASRSWTTVRSWPGTLRAQTRSVPTQSSSQNKRRSGQLSQLLSRDGRGVTRTRSVDAAIQRTCRPVSDSYRDRLLPNAEGSTSDLSIAQPSNGVHQPHREELGNS